MKASINMEKVTNPYGDVIIAYEMNDEALPRDHRFPLPCESLFLDTLPFVTSSGCQRLKYRKVKLKMHGKRVWTIKFCLPALQMPKMLIWKRCQVWQRLPFSVASQTWKWLGGQSSSLEKQSWWKRMVGRGVEAGATLSVLIYSEKIQKRIAWTTLPVLHVIASLFASCYVLRATCDDLRPSYLSWICTYRYGSEMVCAATMRPDLSCHNLARATLPNYQYNENWCWWTTSTNTNTQGSISPTVGSSAAVQKILQEVEYESKIGKKASTKPILPSESSESSTRSFLIVYWCTYSEPSPNISGSGTLSIEAAIPQTIIILYLFWLVSCVWWMIQIGMELPAQSHSQPQSTRTGCLACRTSQCQW